MDTFDSRYLRNTDCFGQRFERPGSYPYAVVQPAGIAQGHLPFAIEVERSDGEARQHNVVVRREGRHLVAEPPVLTIATGDTVIWNAPDPTTPVYSVEGEKEFFSSSAMRREAGFSHAFLAPGEYHWHDANGNGKVAGVIRVNDVRIDTDSERKRWARSLTKPTVVMVGTNSCDPEEVEIVLGQTVFFVVGRADGISITARHPEPRSDDGAQEENQASRPPGKRPTAKKAGKKPAKRAAVRR